MKKPLDRLFGLHAKRLADLIGEQGRDAYDLIGVAVDAKWNSLIMALAEGDGATSTELAARTGLSRQLVEHRIRKMTDAKLITSEVDKEDARRRLYRINPRQKKLVQDVHDAMAKFEKVYSALWKEIGIDGGEAILRIESALLAKPLDQRYAGMFPSDMKSKSKDVA